MQTREGATYAVAGGSHITILLDGTTTRNVLDAVDVLAAPGGGPPPHRHGFAEWLRVLEGDLTLALLQEGKVAPDRILSPGDTFWVPPWTVHGVLNLSGAPVRFQIVGQPAGMAGYVAEAGVALPSETAVPEHPPAQPQQLADVAGRWGIEFWEGPADSSPIVQPR